MPYEKVRSIQPRVKKIRHTSVIPGREAHSNLEQEGIGVTQGCRLGMLPDTGST